MSERLIRPMVSASRLLVSSLVTSGYGQASAKLIVVDDDVLIGEVISAAALSQGVDCVAVTDPAAVDALLDEDLSPVVVLADVDLRSSETGIEAAHRWRSQRPDLRVVLMSGHSADMLDGLHAGDITMEFIQKPFRVEQVLALVRSEPPAS